MRWQSRGRLPIWSRMIQIPDTLWLPVRAGLPDSHSPLRAGYPAADWSGHQNYGQLAAFWLQVHAGLRSESAAITAILNDSAEAVRDPDAFARRFVPALNGLLGHLDAHHRVEDAHYFPKFRAADARVAAGFDVLEHDHELIHEQIDATVASARTLLAALPAGGDALLRAHDAQRADAERLRALLVRHLADEEEIVIPALLEHGERSVA